MNTLGRCTFAFATVAFVATLADMVWSSEPPDVAVLRLRGDGLGNLRPLPLRDDHCGVAASHRRFEQYARHWWRRRETCTGSLLGGPGKEQPKHWRSDAQQGGRTVTGTPPRTTDRVSRCATFGWTPRTRAGTD